MKKESAWKVQGDYFAERSDGVVADHGFYGTYHFSVKRPLRGRKKPPYWEHMPGKAKSVRTFGSLAAAMKAADAAWPLKTKAAKAA